MSECSKGWGARCAASKGLRCRCRCGGENHGAKKTAAGSESVLTNPKVFEPEWDEQAGEFRTYHYFLSGSEQLADIKLTRTQDGDALANVPQRFIYHSPTGFEWGYCGSGPADLALNILALFVPPPEAWRLHQDFKWAFIATSPRETHIIPAASIRSWIDGRWKMERAESVA